MAEERTFLIKIITPERVFYEGKAVMAEFNTSEGEIGVYAGHIPMTVNPKAGRADFDGGIRQKESRPAYGLCGDPAGSDFDSGRGCGVARRDRHRARGGCPQKGGGALENTYGKYRCGARGNGSFAGCGADRGAAVGKLHSIKKRSMEGNDGVPENSSFLYELAASAFL